MSASSSSMTTSMTNSLTSPRELCINCQSQPYDIICTCGDKFDFTCLHVHVEQMGLEFQFLQTDVGVRLLNVEQTVEDDSCTNASTIIENWVCIHFNIKIQKKMNLFNRDANV